MWEDGREKGEEKEKEIEEKKSVTEIVVAYAAKCAYALAVEQHCTALERGREAQGSTVLYPMNTKNRKREKKEDFFLKLRTSTNANKISPSFSRLAAICILAIRVCILESQVEFYQTVKTIKVDGDDTLE